MGVTALRSGASFCKALTSSSVSVCTVVASSRAPAEILLLGRMMIIFDPIPLRALWMLCFDPWPIATMAITAPTPMMIPSMVRKARSLLRCSAFNAIRRRLKRLMVTVLMVVVSFVVRRRRGRCVVITRRQRGQHLTRGFLVLVEAILDHPAILEHDRPAAKGGDVGLVRHEDYRPALCVELLDEGHDTIRTAGIQVARGLICQDHHGLVDQRPRDGHTLLLSARQLARRM